MASMALPLGQAVTIFDERELMEHIAEELARKKAIRVQGDSVMFNPKYMRLGHFYFVELENEPYLYRKVSEHEVEVYGLAEQT
ncbi:hypothetical protein M1N05_00695 [Dehalococcoidales bacterium]|nr:hypothetical protein [Dehalococcoidales bacterium]